MSVLRMDPDEPRPLTQPLRRIAVLRALHLGDMLCAEPALRALRAAQPTAQITLIGLPWAQQFLRRYPRLVDELLVFGDDDHLPAPDDPRFIDVATAMRARSFDLVIQMQGDGSTSNALARAFGSPCAGFHPPDVAAPGPRHLPWDAAEGEVLRWLRLMRHLGATTTDTRIEFAIERADQIEAASLLDAHGVPPRYVCMHVGARLPSRRWPAARYARVAETLAALGWGVVLTGSAGEAPLTAAVVAELDGRRGGRPALRISDLSGQTSLGGLAAVIAGAAALVCNDTGVSHVAAALQIPSVIIACGSDVRRWAPVDRRRHRVLAHPVACRPCAAPQCPYDHACAHGISHEAVIDTCLELLSPENRRAA